MSVALARAAELTTPPPKGTPYSIALEGTEQHGRTKIYRHWQHKDGLLTTLDPKITTTHDLFEQTANEIPDANCLGYRSFEFFSQAWGAYEWQTYSEVQERRKNFGIGIAMLHEQLGISNKGGVGLWCMNRPEWQVVDLGCISQSYYTVSLYDTLGPDATEYIINHAGLNVICCSSDHIQQLQDMAPRCPSLRMIISLDTAARDGWNRRDSKGLLQPLKDAGLTTYTIDQVEDMGATNPRPYHAPKADDIVTINYTSGTTGFPKGVLLTHANAVAAASCAMVIIQCRREDTICSYLPLAHIFERVAEVAALWAGSSIGYYHGNMLEIVDDFRALRPTKMVNVPRLYSRFGAAIKDAVGSNPGNNAVVGGKIKQALGLDRCRVMITGSAPLDASLHDYLRTFFGNTLNQGYGLTETYAIALAQTEGDSSVGNCGACVPSAELCLEDVPDLEYLTSDKPSPRGELLIRSKTQFKEYFNDTAETKKAFTPDGWFRTGDICTVDDQGRFRIIDRKKNILKLAQGEYVSPERIENVYMSNITWASQACVHGDSDKASLVAIFGIQPDKLAGLASEKLGRQIAASDIEALKSAASETVVLDACLRDLEKVGRENGLNGFERVKAVRLLLEPFSVENELLTPTLKLKRQHAARHYRHLLDQMYAESNKPIPVAKINLRKNSVIVVE